MKLLSFLLLPVIALALSLDMASAQTTTKKSKKPATASSAKSAKKSSAKSKSSSASKKSTAKPKSSSKKSTAKSSSTSKSKKPTAKASSTSKSKKPTAKKPRTATGLATPALKKFAESQIGRLSGSQKSAFTKLLNSGKRDELMKVPGIGEKLAGNIVKKRPFKNPVDIANVNGISEAKLKALLAHIKKK